MQEILGRMGEVGLVPVIKLETAAKAPGLGKALVAGGIPVAEVTFRTAAAPDAIRALRDQVPELLVGAGTVLSVAQAEEAMRAGAAFVVSPSFNPAVVDWCLGQGLPVLPGVTGPEGVELGLARGLEVLKFFPAEASGGIPMLDSLAGPYAGMRFVPTGGIDAGNLGAYARRPQVHAVGGSWMVKPELVEAEDWAAVERLAKEAVLALHGFAFAHLGVNGAGEEEARSAAALLAALFGFSPREGSGSIFVSDAVELTKRPFPGERGHIAVRCNDVERAAARFAAMGVATLPETAKVEKGRLKAVYLDTVVLGFAIHLLRA